MIQSVSLRMTFCTSKAYLNNGMHETLCSEGSCFEMPIAYSKILWECYLAICLKRSYNI